jgi:hypothetical protein
VRVEVGLANRGGGPLAAPLRLGLKGGHVRGRVVDPDGRERWFWPLVRCIDSEQLAPIAPGAERRRPLALLRGPHGALFPTAGRYRVWVEAVWPLAGRLVDRAAECAVTVTPAADAAHAAAAREVLGSPELLLTLALAGDHLEAGRRALAAALADPRLRPHYAAIAARCALGRHHEGEGARAEARRLLRGGLVAGHHELAKLRRRLRRMRA